MSDRPLTTGEHKTLTLSSETEILLARRIDTLEHALSLKDGGYSPHRIAMDNFGLIDENNTLRSRVEALESVVREASCKMWLPCHCGRTEYMLGKIERCKWCLWRDKATALLAPPANEGTPERKGGE